MANIKFSCPQCQQHIEAEPGYAGLQINCPACHAGMIVPGTPSPAAPAPSRVTLATHTASAPPSSPPASGCPSCGAALSRGAVLCTQCGYNLATGKRMVAGKQVAPGKPAADQWQVPWYKTPYPYVGAVVLVLALLYFLGRSNPAYMLALIGIAILYSLVTHIIVIVAAFRQSVGTGFLTLCVPFFGIYFVFKISESDMLKIMYGAALLINVGLKFLPEI